MHVPVALPNKRVNVCQICRLIYLYVSACNRPYQLGRQMRGNMSSFTFCSAKHCASSACMVINICLYITGGGGDACNGGGVESKQLANSFANASRATSHQCHAALQSWKDAAQMAAGGDLVKVSHVQTTQMSLLGAGCVCCPCFEHMFARILGNQRKESQHAATMNSENNKKKGKKDRKGERWIEEFCRRGREGRGILQNRHVCKTIFSYTISILPQAQCQLWCKRGNGTVVRPSVVHSSLWNSLPVASGRADLLSDQVVL